MKTNFLKSNLIGIDSRDLIEFISQLGSFENQYNLNNTYCAAFTKTDCLTTKTMCRVNIYFAAWNLDKSNKSRFFVFKNYRDKCFSCANMGFQEITDFEYKSACQSMTM
jgi:hypothetical protein